MAVGIAALVLLAGCQAAPRTEVYDLAAEAAIAEWIDLDGGSVVRSPLSEITYLEPRVLGGDEGVGPAVLSALDVQLFATWSEPAPREAALHLESGPGAAAAIVALNRTRLGRVPLREGRHTYRVGLPAEAQRAGRNRIRLTFEPESAEDAPDGTPFHGAWLAPAGSPIIEKLVAADRPPIEVTGSGEGARLSQWVPGRIRYALRRPAGGQLQVGARAAGAAAGDARYGVTVESDGRPARTLLSETLDASARDHAISLPGREGDILLLSLEATGEDFTGVQWLAPRVSGVTPPPREPVEREHTEALRERLQDMSVIVVVLDAARARQLSSYGYPRSTTLEIDRLGREGVVFEQAYSPASYTISAMSSLWTSLQHAQHHHGIHFRGPLPPEHLTLAEILETEGVKTFGVVANLNAGRLVGLHRGFGEFVKVAGLEGRAGPRAERLAEAVIPFLDRVGEERFFGYVHFLEPHVPYGQPEPFVTLFGPDGPITAEERREIHWVNDVNQRRRPMDAETRRQLVSLYDGNLAYVDREVGRLRRQLEDRELLEKVVLVVTADHGDELWEHGLIGHGATVYEEVLRIPLVMRFPEGVGPAGLRVDTPVDLIDLAPTVLDIFGLAGAGASDQAFEGRSLLPVLHGAPGRPTLLGRSMHERPWYSLRSGPDKLVYSMRTGRTELYRIRDDPDESRDLAAVEPALAEYLRQVLFRRLRSLERRRGTRSAEELPEEAEEALRALGYIH